MTNFSRVIIPSLAFALAASSEAGNAATLCKASERVAFSCIAGKKTASLCASGDLQQSEGRLIYRFGKDASHIELEHGVQSNPSQSGFSFDYSPWAKGASTTVGFKRGQFSYFVNHAAGVYGVDGGPNMASVRVVQGSKTVADIACDEARAIDHMYEELQKLGLPAAGAY